MDRGLIAEADIDRAVRRILRLRFELGEYDPPEDNPYTRIPLSVIQSDSHLALAREAARKSLVLLENRSNTLPLTAERDHTVLVTGPTSVDLQILLGNFYKGSSGNLTSLLEGITAQAPEGVVINHSQGCFLTHPNHYDSDWVFGLAENATTVVACLGYSPLMEGEQGECIGAPLGGDKDTICLPDNQLVFLRDLRRKIDAAHHEANLVVVVTGGGPLELMEVRELADALLFAWYPGQEGGHAVGEILWGKESPSGKLPVTFPKRLEDLPAYEDYSMAERSYRFMSEENILYPFGFGLSYTTFESEPCRVERTDGKTFVNLTVHNRGECTGETVVQVIVRSSREGRPVKKLIAFQRIRLEAGTSQDLRFELEEIHATIEAVL